jgi:type IV fimbrial biogenesis protein FimT
MKTLQRGVTLIELAIVLAVVALLYSLAAPSFTVWIHSAQIRTAAESMQNGLQLARAEAIRRNRSVYFWLSSTATPKAADWLVGCSGLSISGAGAVPEAVGDCPGSATDVAAPANATGSTGINWIQRQAASDQQITFPQIQIFPNNTTGVVTFGSLGLVVANADGTTPLTEIDVSDPSLTTAHPLHVTISGGQIRMCDPSTQLPSTDPRHC